MEFKFDVTNDTVDFPWFPIENPEYSPLYSDFVTALCETAKSRRRVTAKPRPASDTGSDKFSFRVFLVSLGLNGSEHKETRRVLLSRLSGSSSFPRGNAR